MLSRPYVKMTRTDVREIYRARDELRYYKRLLFDAARAIDFKAMNECRKQMNSIRQRIKQEYDVIL
ncbi:hypothetical protein P364_0101330 [Paenibacillus sp. MAEPY2]|nr:hypothetical protein P364_0101330 [Paenibacillus sp. MAEPY2]KGP88139.1 hypothetical protein P363_0108235 [Paenibacillus sp. MAEPY1]